MLLGAADGPAWPSSRDVRLTLGGVLPALLIMGLGASALIFAPAINTATAGRPAARNSGVASALVNTMQAGWGSIASPSSAPSAASAHDQPTSSPTTRARRHHAIAATHGYTLAFLRLLGPGLAVGRAPLRFLCCPPRKRLKNSPAKPGPHPRAGARGSRGPPLRRSTRCTPPLQPAVKVMPVAFSAAPPVIDRGIPPRRPGPSS